MRRIWILVILLMCFAALASSSEVVPLGFDAGAFKEAFNAAAAKGRLVVVLSPT